MDNEIISLLMNEKVNESAYSESGEDDSDEPVLPAAEAIQNLCNNFCVHVQFPIAF